MIVKSLDLYRNADFDYLSVINDMIYDAEEDSSDTELFEKYNRLFDIFTKIDSNDSDGLNIYSIFLYLYGRNDFKLKDIVRYLDTRDYTLYDVYDFLLTNEYERVAENVIILKKYFKNTNILKYDKSDSKNITSVTNTYFSNNVGYSVFQKSIIENYYEDLPAVKANISYLSISPDKSFRNYREAYERYAEILNTVKEEAIPQLIADTQDDINKLSEDPKLKTIEIELRDILTELIDTSLKSKHVLLSSLSNKTSADIEQHMLGELVPDVQNKLYTIYNHTDLIDHSMFDIEYNKFIEYIALNHDVEEYPALKDNLYEYLIEYFNQLDISLSTLPSVSFVLFMCGENFLDVPDFKEGAESSSPVVIFLNLIREIFSNIRTIARTIHEYMLKDARFYNAWGSNRLSHN